MTLLRGDEAPARAHVRRPVAFFLPSLAGGGGERVTLALAAEIAARGVAVDLVVGNTSGALLGEVPDRVRLVDLGCRRMVSTVVPLVRYLRRERPSHLLPTIDHANVVALLAAELARTDVRVVIRVVNTLSVFAAGASTVRERASFALARRLYSRAADVVACSQGVADDLAVCCGIRRDQIRVLAHGPMYPRHIDRLAAAALDHPFFAAGEPPVVLGVGRLMPQKNFPLLVDAFARLRSVRPARLVLLGDGPLRESLLQQAADRGVAEDVDLVRFDVNPYRYMTRAAVFVLSSDYEGLPGALVEAVACGAAVIATDCPSGPHEILEGGAQAPLVPVGDLDALSAALVAAVDDPRRPGRQAVTRYSADGVTRAYLDLLGRADA